MDGSGLRNAKRRFSWSGTRCGLVANSMVVSQNDTKFDNVPTTRSVRSISGFMQLFKHALHARMFLMSIYAFVAFCGRDYHGLRRLRSQSGHPKRQRKSTLRQQHHLRDR
jgi:hypothetical protein